MHYKFILKHCEFADLFIYFGIDPLYPQDKTKIYKHFIISCGVNCLNEQL